VVYAAVKITARWPADARHRSRAVCLSINSEPLLVDGSVMPATQQRQVREGRGATVRPVTEVMPLPERQSAAWEATGSIARVERSPQRGRNRARPGPDFDNAPVWIVPHHHPARVARQAVGRFRGNAHALLEHGLTRLLRVCQHLGIDVDDRLIPLSGRAGIEAVVEGGLRE
jgi:hypothetical protein